MELFLLYMWTMLDRLNLVLVLVFLLSGACCLGGMIYASEASKEEDEKKGIKNAKRAFAVCLTMLVSWVLLPSKKDSLVLGAGYAIVSIAKSEKVGSVSKKAMEYIEQELGKAISK